MHKRKTLKVLQTKKERAKTNGYLPPLRSQTDHIAPTDKASS